MLKYLSSIIKLWSLRRVFPQANIALTAHVSIDSKLGIGTVIRESSSISKSDIGDHVMIYKNNKLSHVTTGRFCYFSEGSFVTMAKFGSFCSVGPYLICGHGEHPTSFVSTCPIFYSTKKQCGLSFSKINLFEENQEITIGNDVWIGARVLIRDGVKIGNGAIIAAGSVVVKDVPDYAIVGGVPAKIIRYRFSETEIEKLISIKWWDWSEEKLRNAQPYLAQSDILSFFYSDYVGMA